MVPISTKDITQDSVYSLSFSSDTDIFLDTLLHSPHFSENSAQTLEKIDSESTLYIDDELEEDNDLLQFYHLGAYYENNPYIRRLSRIEWKYIRDEIQESPFLIKILKKQKLINAKKDLLYIRSKKHRLAILRTLRQPVLAIYDVPEDLDTDILEEEEEEDSIALEAALYDTTPIAQSIDTKDSSNSDSIITITDKDTQLYAEERPNGLLEVYGIESMLQSLDTKQSDSTKQRVAATSRVRTTTGFLGQFLGNGNNSLSDQSSPTLSTSSLRSLLESHERSLLISNTEWATLYSHLSERENKYYKILLIQNNIIKNDNELLNPSNTKRKEIIRYLLNKVSN